MLETFVPYVHEVVVRYMAQSWVLHKSSKIAGDDAKCGDTDCVYAYVMYIIFID